jgi:hypothetical protein
MKRLTLIVLALALVTSQPFAQTQTNSPVQRGTTTPLRFAACWTVTASPVTGAAHAGGVAFAGMSVDNRRQRGDLGKGVKLPDT